MNRFKNILAVYGDAPGADDVLVQAIALARANGARLKVVKPCENPRSAMYFDEADRQLSRIVPWMVREGVPDVETEVFVGTPHVEIIRRALLEERDLVIVNAEGNRALKDIVFGSTAANLIRNCPSAVWVLKPYQSVRCSNIMAAVNPCLDDPCGDDLSTKILDIAASLTRTHDACLHVAHYWEVEGGEMEMLKSEVPRNTKQRILVKHETMRREALNTMLARQSTSHCAHEIHLPRGRPDFHIAGLTARLAVDLIVMGSQGRTGVSRMLKGNFAEFLLDAVRCSVLAVKPNGFHVPMALPEEEVLPKRARMAAH